MKKRSCVTTWKIKTYEFNFPGYQIIIDLIAHRKPFSKFAIEIFKKAEDKTIRLYTSSHTIATTHYLMKKYADGQTPRKIIYNLLNYLNIVAVDETVIRKGLRSNHKEVEDAIQMICANSINPMDCIVTRNEKDFKGSGIAVLSPDEVCKHF